MAKACRLFWEGIQSYVQILESNAKKSLKSHSQGIFPVISEPFPAISGENFGPLDIISGYTFYLSYIEGNIP